MTLANTNHESPITNHVGNETRENTTMRHKLLFSSFLFCLFSAAPAAWADHDCAMFDAGICSWAHGDEDIVIVEDDGASGDDFGVYARTGNGNIELDLSSSGFSLGGPGDFYGSDFSTSDVGIFTQADGIATIDLTGQVAPFSPGDPTFGGGVRVFGESASIRSVGNRVVINLSGEAYPAESRDPGRVIEDGPTSLTGTLDFTGLTGGAEINLGDNASWAIEGEDRTATNSEFSPVADTVNVGPNAYLLSAPVIAGTNQRTSPGLSEDVHTVDFGDGDDVLNNMGAILVGSDTFGGGVPSETERSRYEAELRFENLNTLNNMGTIYMGALVTRARNPDIEDPTDDVEESVATDRRTDDMLVLQGTEFVGSGSSRVLLDVNLNSTVAQSSCDPGLRNADGDLPVADCIDIRGGGASGRTELRLLELFPGDRGAYNPDGTVIVDLSGGAPDAIDPRAFVIDPATPGYDPILGGSLNKGLFAYPLLYDENTQQFKLHGVLAPGGQQLPLLAHAAQTLWRDSSTSWFERQLDLREALREGADLTGGAWVRTGITSAERDVATPLAIGGQEIAVDNSYEQDSNYLNLGLDFLAGQDGNRGWVFGGQLGYVKSDVSFDQSPNSALLEGALLGAYGSYIHGPFFVDASVTGNWLSTVEFDVPALDLSPEDTVVSTDVRTLGAEVEAGWQLPMGWLDIEPLAGFSYATTKFDNFSVPADDPERLGGEISYDDTTSTRGSLGLRLGADRLSLGPVPRIGLSLTTRVVEEFDGDSEVTIVNTGPIDAQAADTFDGTFIDVTGGVTVSNTSGSAAGYLNVDGTFESDYESLGVSAGFRYQW